MRFAVYAAMMVASVTAINLETNVESEVMTNSNEMKNSWAAQVDEGSISAEEFNILAQCLDGDLDPKDFAQTETHRSEGFLAGINTITNECVGGMCNLGKNCMNGFKDATNVVSSSIINSGKAVKNLFMGSPKKGGKK